MLPHACYVCNITGESLGRFGLSGPQESNRVGDGVGPVVAQEGIGVVGWACCSRKGYGVGFGPVDVAKGEGCGFGVGFKKWRTYKVVVLRNL
ncbi:hypothetical protein HanHA300_Chr06g0223961 [Helianthus annuus]|nr:hypothetical protein HanHA300_Chr06g0223961 [Helianthus annuus]KAJ0574593.1 hypothetical protein HanHA89_Chr06g0239911 [Helianthus annuus]KAJ0738925.1 hypothetical protein HanLR1_Chr06g0223821 [Helianthus annuus]KAJ0741792.1 hypothetical protein HanOQP8_Chr06g0232091 [Helianthus annuus]